MSTFRLVKINRGSFSKHNSDLEKCLYSPWIRRPRRTEFGTRVSIGCPPQGRGRGSEMWKTLPAPANGCRTEPPAPTCPPDPGPLSPRHGGPVRGLSPPPEHVEAREDRPSTASSSPGYPADSGRRGAGRVGRWSWQLPSQVFRWIGLTSHANWYSPPSFFFIYVRVQSPKLL